MADPRPCPRLLCLVSWLLVLLCPIVGLAESSPSPKDSQFLRMYLGEEALVESATRNPKPLSQVAENVSVITADEIEAMNAHTLADILDRVTGVFVQFFGHQFGAEALPHIQGSGMYRFGLGSEERYVSVFVDGVPWNSSLSGSAIESIPVGIIQRVEVIKGPASSTWGSALGGVINVITKKTGRALVPDGDVSASYGERNASDLRGELSGGYGPVGYYLEGQRQRADWEGAGGGFESRSGFAKVHAGLAPAVSLSLSGGYSRPEIDAGHLKSQFALAQDEFRSRFARAELDAHPAGALSLHAIAFRVDQRQVQSGQEDGTFGPAGSLLREIQSNQVSNGVQGRAVWTAPGHTAVLGADYSRTTLDQVTDSGAYYQSQGAPAHFEVEPSIDRWGIYLNDTASRGPFTLIPGVRYDGSSKTGGFWSPSVGATWRLGSASLLRASVARGFTIPPLAYLSGGGIDVDPNPNLDPEEVWSYQLGLESTALPHLWWKITGFRHDVSNALEAVPSAGPRTTIFENLGSVRRTGVEAELETAAYRGVSVRGGVAYVRVDPAAEPRQDQYEANAALSYRGWLQAQLFGHFVWWDLGPGSEEGRHNDFLWDLNLSRTVFASPWASVDMFLTVHNLFNGDQEVDVDRGTASRWVEGGIRLAL